MSVSSAFLWRFLEDVWDLLPTKDRELFQAYWSGQLQIASNLEQKAIEAALSTEVANVPVFLTERWNRFLMNEDFCDLFVTSDSIELSLFAESSLSRETAFYDTISVSSPSGQVARSETIRLFDDGVHNLRYGKIIEGTVFVSLLGFIKEGTGAAVTTSNQLTKTNAFAAVEEGMVLEISAAMPGTPIGIFTVRAVLDDDNILINEDFGVASASAVAFKITSKLIEFTANRDYAINLEDGSIQALEDGRISPNELLVVRYQHREYTRGLDYEINETRGTVVRIVGTAIATGQTIVVSYTYNATATLPLSGNKGSADFQTFIDRTKDFSTLLPSRTLTIKSGPNEGSFPINAVVSPTELRITGTFPVSQETDVEYSINAFPHGVKVDSGIESIPVLQDLIDNPTSLLIEDVDFRVSGGILSVKNAFRLASIGPEDLRERQSWAEVTKIDEETPYRNFGVLIDFFRTNSEEYKLALQGLWYTFWTGSTPGNLQRGLHILLGLPFARKAGTVTRVDTVTGEIDVTDSPGQIITYVIPTGLAATVVRGESVDRFDSLTTGVQIFDRNNDPGFISKRLGRAGIAQYLTSEATIGVGDTDETKALTLLEHHLFLPQVLTEAITQRINVSELVTFLENMKPKWGDYVFSFAVEEDETITVSEDLDPLGIELDLTLTVGSNPINRAASKGKFQIQSAAALPTTLLITVSRGTGRILAGGTQLTGNFQDTGLNFVDLGIGEGDILQLNEGPLRGNKIILKRISTSILALDIPDNLITGQSNLDYVLLPSERMLDRDSVNIHGEHIKQTGTEYFVPAGLNTKTDADLAGSGLRNEDVKALLLIDIGLAGNEVQAITDADVENNEIDVGVAPSAPVTRGHEIASAALKRTDNLGPTVTDAFAI